jgi:alpha-N-acetylglucosaminidase
MFNWVSDGDGTLDTYQEVGGFTAGVHVRLAKQGEKLTGSCSRDGTNWAVVGTGTVPGAATTEDVGVFVSAVNRHSGQEAIATFAGGIVAAPDTSRDSSGDTVQSLRTPVTALSSESGHPATAANDGSRSNSTFHLTEVTVWGRRGLTACALRGRASRSGPPLDVRARVDPSSPEPSSRSCGLPWC